jgi:transposase
VSKGSGNGTTRGDLKRNARRERLRGLLPRDGVVIGIDLAEDKQALAVVDHDVRVLARETVKVKGFAHVALACEPAGEPGQAIRNGSRRLSAPLDKHLLTPV